MCACWPAPSRCAQYSQGYTRVCCHQACYQPLACAALTRTPANTPGNGPYTAPVTHPNLALLAAVRHCPVAPLAVLGTLNTTHLCMCLQCVCSIRTFILEHRSWDSPQNVLFPLLSSAIALHMNLATQLKTSMHSTTCSSIHLTVQILGSLTACVSGPIGSRKLGLKC